MESSTFTQQNTIDSGSSFEGLIFPEKRSSFISWLNSKKHYFESYKYFLLFLWLTLNQTMPIPIESTAENCFVLVFGCIIPKELWFDLFVLKLNFNIVSISSFRVQGTEWKGIALSIWLAFLLFTVFFIPTPHTQNKYYFYRKEGLTPILHYSFFISYFN